MSTARDSGFNINCRVVYRWQAEYLSMEKSGMDQICKLAITPDADQTLGYFGCSGGEELAEAIGIEESKKNTTILFKRSPTFSTSFAKIISSFPTFQIHI